MLDCIGTIAPWPQFFALRYLARRTPPTRPLIGEVLVRTAGYLGYRLSRGFLMDFCTERLEAGEAPTFVGVKAKLESHDREELEQFLESLEGCLGAPLLASYKTWRTQQPRPFAIPAIPAQQSAIRAILAQRPSAIRAIPAQQQSAIPVTPARPSKPDGNGRLFR